MSAKQQAKVSVAKLQCGACDYFTVFMGVMESSV